MVDVKDLQSLCQKNDLGGVSAGEDAKVMYVLLPDAPDVPDALDAPDGMP